MQHHVTMYQDTHSASYQTKCHHLVFVHIMNKYETIVVTSCNIMSPCTTIHIQPVTKPSVTILSLYTQGHNHQTCHHAVSIHIQTQLKSLYKLRHDCSLYKHWGTIAVAICIQAQLQSLPYALFRHDCSRYIYSGTITVGIFIQAQLQSLPYALFRHNCSSYIHSGEIAVAKCTEAQFHWGTIAVDVLIQSGTIIRRHVPMQSPYTLKQSQNVSACIDYTPGRQTSCHGALFIPFQPNIAHMLQFKDAIVIRL